MFTHCHTNFKYNPHQLKIQKKIIIYVVIVLCFDYNCVLEESKTQGSREISKAFLYATF